MNGDLILIIPVLLIIIAIMFLVRHMRGGSDDSIAALIGIVPIVIVIGVAIGIIVSMASIADPWEWDADSKTLTIDGNIHDTGLSYPWTGYADRIESLVIEPGVEFVQGPAFARMTNLKYVDIAEGVTLDDGAFTQTFKDPFDADIAIADVAGYKYVAYEGVMYQCDPEIFIYTSGGNAIAGLVNTEAIYLVLPRSHNGNDVTSVGGRAFESTGVAALYSVPDSNMVSIGAFSFQNCTSLTVASLPDSLVTLSDYAFAGCTALADVEMPDGIRTIGNYAFRYVPISEVNLPEGLTSIGAHAFRDCDMLEEVLFPQTLESIGNNAFQGCSSVETFRFNGGLSSIGTSAFTGATAVTLVSFGSGFGPAGYGTGTFPWTFYASDGTTVIDKTVASNLAGKTFEGTAAALIEVPEGSRGLTDDMKKIVHQHDAELERIRLEAISIDPLPFELQDA